VGQAEPPDGVPYQHSDRRNRQYHCDSGSESTSPPPQCSEQQEGRQGKQEESQASSWRLTSDRPVRFPMTGGPLQRPDLLEFDLVARKDPST
jgi:hypothetical protein